MSYQGGYYLINEPLIRPSAYAHTASSPRPIPDEQLIALNRIQETPWRLNDGLGRVLEDAVQSNSTVAALPSMEDEPLPPKIPPEVWEGMTVDQKAEIKAARERIWSRNAKAAGQREALLRKLALARDLRGRTFWFPHSADWRGRAYALPQDLNVQQDDIARGCLQFAEGRPLGSDGMYHLTIRGAANFGMDKVSFDERVSWFVDNERLIVDSATNPLDGERFWCEAEEPWQFLATCMAWVGWLNEGKDYVCHLPIPFDATCSGLQHISAMGLSEYGGQMVNLTSDPQRYDVYQVVADKVAAIVEADAALRVEEALNWRGQVTRKVVKRPTMTLCYGATPMGMRKMAIDDGHCDDLPGNMVTNAAYVTNCILTAIGDVLAEGKRIMDWLQECAGTLANEGHPVTWTTPMGMEVRQTYYKQAKTRVNTIYGEVTLWDEDKNLGMDAQRSRLAVVPNVIHSFDAAHLYGTINRTAEQMDEEPAWAVVHDSFATWAGEPTRVMNQALREEFVRIYEQDQLGMLYERFAEDAPDVPPPPARGSLNIQEALSSPYFFS